MSSIGLKVLMALSGLVLWGYLVVHLLGNLQILTRPDWVFNDYAEFLKSNFALLWTERVIVFGAMIVHAYTGIRLTKLNRRARPETYELRKPATSTLMSRTMIISGIVVLAFFVYHILHFTVGSACCAVRIMEKIPTDMGARVRPNAFLMVHSAFKNPAVVAVYVVGQILLFAHLLHGAVSSFQSLGGHRLFRAAAVRGLAWLIVLGIFAGNLAIPLIIFFAWPAV
jgi:succinate dehydrogenase cytochrome b subunit